METQPQSQTHTPWASIPIDPSFQPHLSVPRHAVKEEQNQALIGHIHSRTIRRTSFKTPTMMPTMKANTSGVWSTACDYGDTMPLCNTFMRLLLSGVTKFSAGPVRMIVISAILKKSILLQLSDVSFIDDPNDAFWLAQTYFMTHQYSRAERLLTRPFPASPPKRSSTPPQMMNGQDKGKGKEADASQTIFPPRIPMGPGGIIEVTSDQQEKVSRLVDMSVACRYLASQCQVPSFSSNQYPWS